MALDEGVVVPLVAGRALSGAATTFTGTMGATGVGFVALLVNVTAVGGTSPSLTLSVQWSNDGTNWADVDGTADTFAAKTATGATVLRFPVKGLYFRLKEVLSGTSPTATYTATALMS